MLRNAVVIAASLVLSAACGFSAAPAKAAKEFRIFSPAFQNGGAIPAQYTCDGQDLLPALQWENLPKGTRSLALFCEDPVAKKKMFTHMVLYNLPVAWKGISEGFSLSAKKGKLNGNWMFGKNDFGKLAWNGPCPPSGTHQYIFRLFALKSMLILPQGATKQQVYDAFKGSIISGCGLIGSYQKK